MIPIVSPARTSNVKSESTSFRSLYPYETSRNDKASMASNGSEAFLPCRWRTGTCSPGPRSRVRA